MKKILRIIIKIAITIPFTIFGFLYVILASAIHDWLTPAKITYYTYGSDGDGVIPAYILLMFAIFAALWGWIGLTLSKQLIHGILRGLGVLIGTVIYYIAGSKLQLIILGNEMRSPDFMIGMSLLTWWLISLSCAILVGKLINSFF